MNPAAATALVVALAGCSSPPPPTTAAPAPRPAPPAARPDPDPPELTGEAPPPARSWWQTDSPCPGGKLAGAPPPEGDRVKCLGPDGKALGRVTAWYPTGQLHYDGSLRGHFREGPWKSWYPSGQLEESSTYARGVRVGEYTRYFPNGRKAGQTRRSPDGQLVTTRFLENGDVTAVFWIKDGKTVRTRRYVFGEPFACPPGTSERFRRSRPICGELRDGERVWTGCVPKKQSMPPWSTWECVRPDGTLHGPTLHLGDWRGGIYEVRYQNGKPVERRAWTLGGTRDDL